MKNHASKLFFVGALLFYVTAFSSSRPAYIALGTVFLVLGIVESRRANANPK